MSKVLSFVSAYRAIILLIGLALSFFALLSLHSVTASSYENMKDIDAKKAYWFAEIERKGPAEAYEAFAKEALKKEPFYRHTEAHIFGEALFRSRGAEGLAYCDTQFAAGCLHEVFKWLIAEEGVEKLVEVARGCETSVVRFKQCEHAIGHGVFSSYGYEQDSLQKALAFCRKHFYSDPINGCVGGVFMEYNLYTWLDPDVNPRPVGSSGRYDACPSLPEEFKQACYTWLPQWWRVSLRAENVPEPDIFKRMGEWCQNVPDTAYRQDCFERLGQHAAYAALEEPSGTIEYCALAAGDERDMLSCRSYAAFVITYNDKTSLDMALRVCDGLQPEALAYCSAYARNDASKQHPLPFPDLSGSEHH